MTARTGDAPVAAHAPVPAREQARRVAWWAPLWRTAGRHPVLLACAATLLVHLAWLTRRLEVDEGGFAMVARHWHEGGRFLYGPQWVDRPPGLLAVFAGAQHLGPYGVRLTAAVVAVVLVAAVAWAADAVGGGPAAGWAAWAAFALASSALLETEALNGELVAAAFVALSVAAVLRALRRPSGVRALLDGVAGGASASLAVLMKQNFVDGFVFAAVLLTLGVVGGVHARDPGRARVVPTAAGLVVGAVVPFGTVVAWAGGHGGLGALLFAMFGFRLDVPAAGAGSWSSAVGPLVTLLVLGALSGLLLLLVQVGLGHGRRLRRLDALAWAVAATVAVEVVGVLAAAGLGTHYLIALIPMVSLAAGLAAGGRGSGWVGTRRLVVLAAAATAVASPAAALLADQAPSQAYATGRWLAASARRGDTVVVPLTHANVIQASALRPGYPYAWSLPARTLDPHLGLLTRTLVGRSAPTWVVPWDDAYAWGLDAAGRVDAALRAHYRPVALVCGHTVWLHDGAVRDLAPTPSAADCGPEGA